jgi:hypothetical protein
MYKKRLGLRQMNNSIGNVDTIHGPFGGAAQNEESYWRVKSQTVIIEA